MKRLLPAIFGLGLGLRVWVFIVGLLEPFWYDEAYSWIISHRGISDMVAATAADVHPPLFYLLVKALPILQPFEMARLLPMLFSLAGLVMFWLLLKELPLSEPARLAALAIMAIAPTQLHYSNELRSYSLMELLVIVQAVALLKRRWWVLGAATLVIIYTHNFGLIYSAIFALIGLARVLITPRDRYQAGMGEWTGTDMKPLLLSFGVPAFLFLPWVGVLFRQVHYMASGNHWIQPLSFGQAVAALAKIVIGVGIFDKLGPVFMMAFIGSFVLVVFYAIRNKAFILLAMALLPWFAAMIISALVAPLMHYRSFIGCLPAIYVLYAMAIDRAARPWKYVGAAVGVGCLVLTLAVYVGMAETLQTKEHYDGQLQFSNAAPIIHLEDTTLITWMAADYPNQRNYLIDSGCKPAISALSPDVRHGLGVQLVATTALPHRFLLVAMLSALSSKCQEDLYNALTFGQVRLMGQDTDALTWGIYDVTLH